MKGKMASTRLTSLVLFGLLFVSSFLRDAFAHDAGHGDKMNGNGLVNAMSVEKKELGSGGRKMMGPLKVFMKEDRKEGGETSQTATSGKVGDHTSKMSSGRSKLNDHQGAASKNTNLDAYWRTNTNSNKPLFQEPHGSAKKVEAQIIGSGSYELLNLMHKDYSGMNMPRRKSPIHNGEPSN